jgi:hypothetical protein
MRVVPHPVGIRRGVLRLVGTRCSVMSYGK